VSIERDANLLKESVDNALAAWRQGDCVVGEQWFVHRLDSSTTFTSAGEDAVAAGGDLAEQEVFGFVVVTQTCDIVRSCIDRPFVEVCPLVEVDANLLAEVGRAQRPAYAFVPGVSSCCLVADLDRTMTVEKPLVATWERTPGCQTDAEARSFALALARKRIRFAFPNDFNQFAKGLEKRLKEKHEKDSDEGRGLRALREIRVQASPAWRAARVELFFWFVRNDNDADFEGTSWADLLSKWLALLPPKARFVAVDGNVSTLLDMTAADYVGSDQLDLDHMSKAR